MLMLHAGANPIDYTELAKLITPEPTATHVPLAHHRIVDTVRHMLSFYGHTVTEEHHGVTEDGAKYFGVLCLESKYGNYQDMIGLRNSHDKTMPIGIAFGSRVFVCDNMAFIADHVVRRKHTIKARHELPALISEIVEPLADQRESQHRKMVTYQGTELVEQEVNHAVMQMYRNKVINLQRIDDVLEAYEEPPHDWGDRTAWRLFNAATFALSGKIAESPATTGKLHEIIDAVCA